MIRIIGFILVWLFLGAGSKTDAKQALSKTLEIDDSHIKARELLDKIGK